MLLNCSYYYLFKQQAKIVKVKHFVIYSMISLNFKDVTVANRNQIFFMAKVSNLEMFDNLIKGSRFIEEVNNYFMVIAIGLVVVVS